MKDDFSNEDNGFFLAACPECVFIPEYPQTFKFDLILADKNYGELEITVNQGLLIHELKGTEEAKEKLDKIAQKYANQPMKHLPIGLDDIVSYPLRDIMDIAEILLESKFKRNGDYQKMSDFIGDIFAPIDHDILYEKTGILFTY